MTTLAALTSAVLEVAPGSQSACELTLRNNGDVVEEYRFQVVGDAAPWATVEPGVVSLYPGAETVVVVSFHPPRSAAVPAGEVPFAVRVLPTEHPESAAAPEGVVRVLAFTDTGAELTPRTSRGRRAKHELALDNRGNLPVTVQVDGGDPDGRLLVSPRPSIVTVPPGQAVFTTVVVRANQRLWRGQPVTHPFQVTVTPDDGARPITLDGAIVQSPVLSPTLARVVAGVLALVLAAIAAWFLLLKPAVRSTAKESVKEPLTQVAEKAANAEQLAKEAKAKAEGSPPPPPPPVQPPAAVHANYRFRLENTVANGGTTSGSPLTLGAKTSLSITDLLFQAPQGDTGKVELLVDGQVLLVFSLANIRDIDHHVATPVDVPAGKTVTLRTTCTTAGPPLAGSAANSCRVWVLLTGVSHTAP
ncbi:hypothetical protein AB0M43_27475 [Longispora sp. NPDC051575]|uniref:COG1470 family protein n=1 Tax=Longispora sp. NPDC051575 TaxID=3154943 RepID=UPI003413AD44